MAESDSQTTKLPRRIVGRAHAKTETNTLDKGAQVTRPEARAFREPVDTLRSRGDTLEAIRVLSRIDGTFSTAIFSMVQIAHSPGKVAAYETATHQLSSDGTQLARSILSRFDTLFDYTKGYSPRRSTASVVETLLREAALTSGCGLELVLDKGRLPDYLQPLNMQEIRWAADGKGGKYPVQRPLRGEETELNVPTVWIEQSHLDPLRCYARSMYEAGLTFTFHFDEFVQDVRRVVRQSGHTRLVVSLDAEKVAAAATSDVRQDPTKMQSYMESVRTEVETVLRQLNPEDAIVSYNAAEFDHLQSGMGSRADYTPLLQTLSGLMATALKSPPSVLGLRLEGSQSLSNTESLVFLKIARAIQVPVAAVLSRALTLACRLYGMDVYVKYQFAPISLRPAEELESFETMRQQNIYRMLSYGFITDDEAAQMLGTGPRAPDAPPLSGTFFFEGGQAQSNAQDPTPNADPMGRSLQPDQEIPRSGGGRDNQRRP